MSLSLAPAAKQVRYRYEVLGRLGITAHGQRAAMPPKAAKLLAVLIIRAGEIVPADKLVAELWGAHPPRRAIASVHVYVSQLRKLLANPVAASPITTATPGYVLEVDDDELDVRDFERLYETGRSRYIAADFQAASDNFSRALSMWRGPVLDGIHGSSEIDSFAAVQEEKRLNCIELGIEADLKLGRHREVVEELRGLVLQHPLREPFYRQLMVALYRVGRQGDALGVYRGARRVIREELGVEPGLPLRHVQEAILRADAARLEAVGSGSHLR